MVFFLTDIFDFEVPKHLGPLHFHIQVCFDVYTLWSACQLLYKSACHLDDQSPKRLGDYFFKWPAVSVCVYVQFSIIPSLAMLHRGFFCCLDYAFIKGLEFSRSPCFESEGYFFPLMFYRSKFLRRGVVKLNISLKKGQLIIF